MVNVTTASLEMSISSALFGISTTPSPWTNLSRIENVSHFKTSTEDYFSYLDYSDYYNIADQSEHAPCDYGRHMNSFLSVLYSIFFIVGFLGNALVLWVIKAGAQLKSMTDVCLLNLAVADLLLVLSLPFLAHYATHSWIFGKVMCRFVLGMYWIGFYSGIFFIVLMSIDRYLAVVHAVFALRVRTKAYGILASLVIWFIAVSASFPELKDLNVEEKPNETLCSAYPNFRENGMVPNDHSLRTAGFIKMNVLGLLIPLIIVGYCYTMVLRRLHTVRTSRKHAVRLVVLVMAVFFCCWTPYNIAALLKALELKHIIFPDCENSKRIQITLQATEAVAYSHSCLNPFLYVFVGQKFKKHLIRLLRKTPCFKLQFMKSYLTQTTGSVYSQTTSVEERSTAI